MNSKVSIWSTLVLCVKMEYEAFRRKQVLLIQECYWIILVFTKAFNCKGSLNVNEFLFFIVIFFSL